MPAEARLRDVLESAIAFYHAVLTGLEDRPAGARLPPRPRLHGRDDRDVPARLRPGRLGHPRPDARRQAPGPRRTSSSRPASPSRASRRGAGSYDRFRERVIFPIRDANGGRGRPRRPDPGRRDRRRQGSRTEVPELAGDAALRQEPDALPDRPGQGAHPQDRAGGDRRGLHRRADGPPGRASTTSSLRSGRR